MMKLCFSCTTVLCFHGILRSFGSKGCPNGV
jgi:hypothetical protein